MDKVFIKDLHLRGILGVHDWERTQASDILINVTLFTDTRRTEAGDDLAECVDYSTAAKKIRTLVDSAERFTVEALTEDIAGLCLRLPKVREVTVRVEKPGAVEEAESVGVEITRKTSQVSKNL